MKNIIQEKRKECGMTQAELARSLGIATSTVAMWENGTNIPRTKTYLELAKIFNCSIGELLEVLEV